MSRLVVGALILSLGVLAPRGAWAQDRRALAKKHYLLGEGFYRTGEFTKALAQYRKALSYKRYPALLFNIAQCHRQLDQPKKAIFFFKLYLAKSPQASNRAQVLRVIRQVQKGLRAAERLRLQTERNKGHLSIVTQPAGARVLVDKLTGKGRVVTPTVIRLKAGQHLVVLSLPGHHTVHRTITVPPRGMALVKVTLAPLSRPRPVEARRPARKIRPQPRPRVRRILRTPLEDRNTMVIRWKMKTVRSSPFYKRWWFWTGLIVGGGALAAGAYFGMQALKNVKEWERTWDDKHKEAGKRYATIADVLFVNGGGVLLGVIIGMAVVGMGTDYEKPVRATVIPSCGPSGCGLWVKGSF